MCRFRETLCAGQAGYQKMAVEDLSRLHVAIVGAGVIGIKSAMMLARRGARITIIEREADVGGVWQYFANEGSRVQVSEPGYRLIQERELSDFTPTKEVLSTLRDAVDMIQSAGGNMVFGATVKNVRNVGDRVHVQYDKAGKTESLAADHAILCTGGLQMPRKIAFPGESLFQGSMVYGIGGEVDKLDMRGKRVLILGMGAFAIENARECLFDGAEHVTFLARARNQIIPQFLTYANNTVESGFISMKEQLKLQRERVKKGVHVADPLSEILKAYQQCNALEAMPSELQMFANTKDPRVLGFRESFGTVPTASDPFFIGHAAGKMATVRGEVARVLPDGVETTDGQKIEASVIIKNFGFEDPDEWIASVVNQSHMHSPVFINERVWLFKAERARMTPQLVKSVGPKAFVDNLLNIPPIAPAIAEVFTELFCYFQAQPEKLRLLLESGQVPHVKIGQCNALTWSLGQRAMTQSDPALQERVDQIRRQIAVDTKKRWKPLEYLEENAKWWRYCCKQITGEEQSVPYLFDSLRPNLEKMESSLQSRL